MTRAAGLPGAGLLLTLAFARPVLRVPKIRPRARHDLVLSARGAICLSDVQYTHKSSSKSQLHLLKSPLKAAYLWRFAFLSVPVSYNLVQRIGRILIGTLVRKT